MTINFSDFLNQFPATKLRNFNFVQIGGFDGVFDDPIRQYIIKYNWSGIIIEPQPEAFSQLIKIYQHNTKITLLNLAITTTNQPTKLYRLKQKTLTENWKNCFATITPDRGDIGQTQLENVENITVTGKNINNLIREQKIKKINLLQIDTEGFDYQIINSLDFSLLKPDIIHYEHRHLPRKEIIACQKILSKQQYHIIPLQHDTIAFQQH